MNDHGKHNQFEASEPQHNQQSASIANKPLILCEPTDVQLLTIQTKVRGGVRRIIKCSTCPKKEPCQAEAIQIATVAVLAHLDKIENLEAYSTTVGTTTAIHILNNCECRFITEVEDDNLGQIWSRNPEESIISSIHLEEIMLQCTPEERETLLTLLYGYTWEEAAPALGCTPGTLRKRYSRLRCKLQALYPGNYAIPIPMLEATKAESNSLVSAD